MLVSIDLMQSVYKQIACSKSFHSWFHLLTSIICINISEGKMDTSHLSIEHIYVVSYYTISFAQWLKSPTSYHLPLTTVDSFTWGIYPTSLWKVQVGNYAKVADCVWNNAPRFSSTRKVGQSVFGWLLKQNKLKVLKIWDDIRWSVAVVCSANVPY
jgi:hypothetical protein